MVNIDILTQVGTLVVAFVGVAVALMQLRQANSDAHTSRMAEMSWHVYQSYIDSRIRMARGAAEYIAHTVPVPVSAAEYGDTYADKVTDKYNLDEETLDTHMRRLLRFYSQVGILVEKELVDDDLVFALIGPGLKSAWPAVQPAIDWYQNYYEGPSGVAKAAIPRPIHAYALKLYQRYLDWEKLPSTTAVSRSTLSDSTIPAVISTEAEHGQESRETDA